MFKHRFLFVQKNLTAKEKETLQEITRGLPALRRLRELIDQVYHLYDRRCHEQTALGKLRRLRRRASSFKAPFHLFKALKSPMLEQSFHFLDDKSCPSTSNAVERCNRRFRKLQKSVYRVRTLEHLRQRIAMDMFRSMSSNDCRQTMHALHDAKTPRNQPP